MFCDFIDNNRLSIIRFPIPGPLSSPARDTRPFPENVRKGLGLGDSVRIDRKGFPLLDFSNFRKGSRVLVTVSSSSLPTS